MSIVTEISRIKSAKSAIAAAIAGKGVTVPDGTLLDGMASLIEAIQAGGGSLVSQGTYTTESDCASISVEHGLGVIPTFAVIYSSYDSGNFGLVFLFHDDSVRHIYAFNSKYKEKGSPLTAAGETSANAYNVKAYGANESFISFGINTSSYSLFRAGYSYQWMVGAIK